MDIEQYSDTIEGGYSSNDTQEDSVNEYQATDDEDEISFFNGTNYSFNFYWL